MNHLNKFSKRTPRTLSLNEDRGDAFWQIERGVRYGVSRKARSKAKVYKRRLERKDKSWKYDATV